MDGLVSNFALIAGVAGGGVSSQNVALAGLTGLFAGALSMASGEYTSVRSQAEVMAVAKGYRERHLPLDTIVVDWFYYTKMGQMDLDPTLWPDPSAMNAEVSSVRGLRLAVSGPTASWKLFFDPAMISVTRATAMMTTPL